MNTISLKLVLVFFVAIGEIGTSIKFVSAHSEREDHHHHIHDGRDGSKDFLNQWIVHLDGTSDAADLLALKLSYENLGEVSKLIFMYTLIDIRIIQYLHHKVIS